MNKHKQDILIFTVILILINTFYFVSSKDIINKVFTILIDALCIIGIMFAYITQRE
jgi:hypothetical protein